MILKRCLISIILVVSFVFTTTTSVNAIGFHEDVYENKDVFVIEESSQEREEVNVVSLASGLVVVLITSALVKYIPRWYHDYKYR